LKGRVSTFKGRKHSDESKNIISQKNKGNISPMKGKKHSIETRIKISSTVREKSKKGVDSHSYKDGRCAERKDQRFTKEYKRWRYDVFARDKFTCQECDDKKGGNLNAHHIKSFANFPSLRLDIDNGITLCEPCHKKKHSK
jgi:5-methylcytosine-specific restriction endonuclease McrA